MLLGIGLGAVITITLIVVTGTGFRGIQRLSWPFTDPRTRRWEEDGW